LGKRIGPKEMGTSKREGKETKKGKETEARAARFVGVVLGESSMGAEPSEHCGHTTDPRGEGKRRVRFTDVC